MNDKRFYLDERVGCIAIRDRNHIDHENKCLTSNMPDVVKYWPGYQKINKCPTCGHQSYSWEIHEIHIKEAKELCDLLNKEAP